MKPCLKPILKGHRGHVEVIAKAFKTEVALFLHFASVNAKGGFLQYEIAVDFVDKSLGSIDSTIDQFRLLDP